MHAIDLLEAEVYSFKEAPGHPIDACNHSDEDVIERAQAWRAMAGEASAGRERAAERTYYGLLQDGTPAGLMPVVHMRRYYYEGLRRCVLALVHRTPQDPTEESNIAILSAENFEAETRDGIVLVDLMTHWCVPCKKMARDLERFARDYKGKMKVGRLDVDRNMATAKPFGFKALPTLLVLQNGREVARLSDAHGYEELKTWADRVLQGRDGG